MSTSYGLQGKTCQNSLLFGGGGSVLAKISWEGVIPREYFFGFYKTRHILQSDSAKCTVLRAVALTQYQRVTGGQTYTRTDGIAIASTANIAACCKNRTIDLQNATLPSYETLADTYIQLSLKINNLLSQ